MKKFMSPILSAVLFLLASTAIAAPAPAQPDPPLVLKFTQTLVDPNATEPECSLVLESEKMSEPDRTQMNSLLKTVGFNFAATHTRHFQNGMREEAHPQGIVFRQFKTDLPPTAYTYNVEIEVNNYKVTQIAKFDDGCRVPKIQKLLQFLLQKCREHKAKNP